MVLPVAHPEIIATNFLALNINPSCHDLSLKVISGILPLLIVIHLDSRCQPYLQ
jgi:hypothetical protein